MEKCRIQVPDQIIYSANSYSTGQHNTEYNNELSYIADINASCSHWSTASYLAY